MRYLDLDRKKCLQKRRRASFLLGGLLLLVVLLLVGLVLCRGTLLTALLRPISFATRLISPVRLQEADGRTNVLVLGLDTRARGGLLNTDTIFVGSFSPSEGDPVIISIPRDLWVDFGDGGQGKINSAYARAALADGTVDEEKGVEAVKAVVEGVLGIPIHYWAVVSFEGFTDIVTTVGGISVCVDRAFDDYAYPIPGRERAPLNQRYEWLHFDAGCQEMDGDLALKYSRSRMGTAGEGSDFARVRRQQKVALAVADKILSLSLLFNPGKITTLYHQVSETIKTNASLFEAQRGLERLYEFQENLADVRSLVLDPDSELIERGSPAIFGKAYVLVPAGGDFSVVYEAVQKLLFSPTMEEEATE